MTKLARFQTIASEWGTAAVVVRMSTPEIIRNLSDIYSLALIYNVRIAELKFIRY